VFQALAKTKLSVSTAREMFERMPELVSVIEGGAPLQTKARAARVLALLLASFGDPQLCRHYLGVVNTVSEDGLDADSLAHLALARLMVYYEAGLAERSLAVAETAVAKLREQGVANLVMGQLEAGLGSISARRGNYPIATRHHETAYNMGLRLGNDSLMWSAAGNNALCFYRLGLHNEQFKWLERALQAKPSEFGGLVDMQVANQLALAHLYAGRKDLGQAAMDAVDLNLSTAVSPWMLQAWSFYKADFLWLSGRPAEAVSVASSELKKSAMRLLSNAFAGPFARWIALTTPRLLDARKAGAQLEGMVCRLDEYDAIDQAEILAAQRVVLSQRGTVDKSLETRLAERLVVLPEATRAQIAMFVGGSAAT
jgi:tetratricopeptide (TPR) repeat protein